MDNNKKLNKGTITLNNNEELEREAEYFTKTDNALTRSVAWSSIPYFQTKINENFNFHKYCLDNELLNGKEKIGLTLACGDMKGEYNIFKKYNTKTIDAFDISEGQKDKFFKNIYDETIEVNYHIEDCNKIKLDSNKYDFIFIQQSFHHLTEIEYVSKELNKALKPDGVFLIIDYIGEPFLQRTHNQRKFARRIWKNLPERLRINPNGRLLWDIYIPNKNHLSPYEAVKSDIIYDTLQREFTVESSFTYGGILFAIFQGFAQNYTNEDLLFIKNMWETDQFLINEKTVEPNFIRAVLRKKTIS